MLLSYLNKTKLAFLSLMLGISQSHCGKISLTYGLVNVAIAT